MPGIDHAFWPVNLECIIGEVSTANDELNDKFFVDPNIGRFQNIEEDAPAYFRLFSEEKMVILRSWKSPTFTQASPYFAGRPT